MSEVVKRYVIGYRTSEGFRYAFEVSEIEGAYFTEEVSAGQHSYDLTCFKTMGREYSTSEVYETREIAEITAAESVRMASRRVAALVKLFDPRLFG